MSSSLLCSALFVLAMNRFAPVLFAFKLGSLLIKPVLPFTACTRTALCETCRNSYSPVKVVGHPVTGSQVHRTRNPDRALYLYQLRPSVSTP